MTKQGFRRQLWTLALLYAREAAKEQIKAKGEKLTGYAAKDLTRMAVELVAKEPERFIGRARDLIASELTQMPSSASEATTAKLGYSYGNASLAALIRTESGRSLF
jgi:hypothetical protein